MNPRVRDKLCQILATYGTSLYLDPRRCENLLRDLCPQHRRELNVLIGALREAVPADLAAMTQRNTAIHSIGRFSKRLEDNLAIAAGPARWAVETWALALGVVTANQLKAAQPPHATNPHPKSPVVPPPVIVARRQPATRSRAILLTVCLFLAGSGVVLAVSFSRPAPPDATDPQARITGAPKSVCQARSEAQPTENQLERVTGRPPVVTEAHEAQATQHAPRASKTTSSITDEEVAVVRGVLFPTLPKVAADAER